MKKLIQAAFFVAVALIIYSCGRGSSEKTISISGAFALYPMEVKWAEEFKKIHPEVKFDISAAGAGKGMVDTLTGMADIGSISREISKSEEEKGITWIAMARDAVVCTVNANNPLLGEILKSGLKKKQLEQIFIEGSLTRWKELNRYDKNDTIDIYTRSDSCGAAGTWAVYFGKKQEDLKGIGVFGDPGVVEAVKKDVFGIGYNNINFAYDSRTDKPVPGIAILPIDINGNGKIDPDEDFYRSLSELTRAISKNKYPSPPARDLYFAFKGRPVKKIVREFVRWASTEGRRYMIENGYVPVEESRAEEQMKTLGI